MSPHVRHRGPLVLAVAFLVIALLVVWYYLLKPWPGVYSSDDWKLVDPPPGSVYTQHQTIVWEKPMVCIPEGSTTVQFLLMSRSDIGARYWVAYTVITTNGGPEHCTAPNRTSMNIPDWLSPGTYQIVLRACTDTPNPRDTCIESLGPEFTMARTTF